MSTFVINLLKSRKERQELRVLEIGCGIGRMTKHLAEAFGEIHATDVSAQRSRRGDKTSDPVMIDFL